MKYILLVLVLAMPSLGQSQAADLRSAAGCGSSKTHFDVKTDKHQHAVTEPESGKALVYVIVEEKRDPHKQQLGDITTRVGLDGNWVGANHGQSYISFAVLPGTHRVCTDWQSRLKIEQELSGAADLIAEPGKTYYYRAELTVPWADHPANLRLEPVDGAEGLLLVSKSASSTWKIKN